MLTEAWCFREPRVVAHGRPEGIGKVALQLLQDLGAFLHPCIVEGRDYALYTQAISVALDLIDTAQEVAYTLQRQNFHRDREQELIGVEEAIDVENVPGGRRV